MELDATKNKPGLDRSSTNKFSARMSVFAWIICAVLGWALAFTSFTTISNVGEDLIITAQNEPSAEEAANMEQILPAAGEDQSGQ